MVVFDTICKNYNKIELTKNKMDFITIETNKKSSTLA